MEVPFRQGNLVIYDPPYDVHDKWLRYKNNKQRFIVVRGNDRLGPCEEPFTSILVTYETYAGFDRAEIPSYKIYNLGVKAFYHAVPQYPSWEL
jgi:hypothetical protein